MTVEVSLQACERFVECVQPCSIADARELILAHSKAIETAAEFKCEIVRLGGGERLVLDGTTVVTVYGRGTLPRQCRRGPHHIGEGEPLWL